MGLLLPILSLVGTAAGAGLNMAANVADTKAENDVVGQELSNQKKFQQRGTDAFQKNVQQNAGLGNAQQQIGQGASEAQKLYATLQGQSTGQPTGLMAPTQQGLVAQQGLTQQQNAAASQIPGLGNWQTQQNVGNILTNSTLGSINSESRDSAANLPALLQGASRTGAGLSGAGGILGSLGMLAGLGGGLSSSMANAPGLGGASAGATINGLDSMSPYSGAGRFIQGLYPQNYFGLSNNSPLG